MPKRRMTPARKAAIAKWQRAGANSRKGYTAGGQARINELKKMGLNPDVKKAVPVGKNITMYHRTTVEAANLIVRQGFRPGKGQLMDRSHVYGVLPVVSENWKLYGKAVVAVRIPRKLASVDRTMDTFYPPPMKVAFKDLKGRKVRRIK
jgi:hypothetical protein